ncbi:hypothetical protein LXL04_036906 [Taraxacum kok-saghyz]
MYTSLNTTWGQRSLQNPIWVPLKLVPHVEKFSLETPMGVGFARFAELELEVLVDILRVDFHLLICPGSMVPGSPVTRFGFLAGFLLFGYDTCLGRPILVFYHRLFSSPTSFSASLYLFYLWRFLFISFAYCWLSVWFEIPTERRQPMMLLTTVVQSGCRATSMTPCSLEMISGM